MSNEIPTSKVIAVTQKVRDLLTDKTHWTKGTSARSQLDGAVEIGSKYAVKFCVNGAAQRCTRSKRISDAVLTEIGRSIESSARSPIFSAIQFNDHHMTTHRKLLAVLDKTIKRLKRSNTQ